MPQSGSCSYTYLTAAQAQFQILVEQAYSEVPIHFIEIHQDLHVTVPIKPTAMYAAAATSTRAGTPNHHHLCVPVLLCPERQLGTVPLRLPRSRARRDLH